MKVGNENWEQTDGSPHYLVMCYRRACIIVAITGLTEISGCCHCPPTVPTPTELTACAKPAPAKLCMPGQCTANSPIINSFPINGMHRSGTCSPEGVQLVPKSLRGGRCDGLTLDVDGNALVGRDEHGKARCRDQDLIGTTFDLKSWAPDKKAPTQKSSLRIRIDSAAAFAMQGGETRPGYLLVWADRPDLGSLCSAKASTEARAALGLEPIRGLATAPSATTDVIIPIRDELYNVVGVPLQQNDQWPFRSNEWLNLACVNDALAERSLHHQLTDNVSRSRAALKLLSANYCGDKPFTIRGTKINVQSSGDPLEARWTQDGASCLNLPRIVYRESTHPVRIPADLPDELKRICGTESHPEACADLESWLAAVHTCGKGRRLPVCQSGLSSEGLESYPDVISKEAAR